MQTPFQFAGRMLFCAALLALAACRKPDAGRDASKTITLESDPPGSEVYLDGASLGRTPCVLSEARLHELGIHWPEYIHKDNSMWMNWACDTGGIIIQQGNDESAWRKLYFKPPERQVAECLTAETPWGKMAFIRQLDRGGADDNHLSYRLVCLRPLTPNGLSLAISIPEGAIKPGAKCGVTLACRNMAGVPVACFRPEVEIYCSRFDEPAMRHSVLKTALPETWRFFKPGEENTASFDFTAPDAGGDYCMFAVATLHEQAAGDNIYETVYSNGKLLRAGQ